MTKIINYFILKVNIVYNHSIMNVRIRIKMLAVSRGMTLKKLAEKLSDFSKQKYTYNSLLGKLNRESLSLKEAEMIATILDYHLEFLDLSK